MAYRLISINVIPKASLTLIDFNEILYFFAAEANGENYFLLFFLVSVFKVAARGKWLIVSVLPSHVVNML